MLLCFVAAGLAAAGLLLLGLPGAFMLMIAEPLAKLFSTSLIGGDQYWPAAIMLTIIGPFALPPSYLAASRLAFTPRARLVVTTCLVTGINVGLATAVMVAGGQ